MKFLLGGESWRVGVVNVARLTCVVRTTTKKDRKLSEKEKVHP